MDITNRCPLLKLRQRFYSQQLTRECCVKRSVSRSLHRTYGPWLQRLSARIRSGGLACSNCAVLRSWVQSLMASGGCRQPLLYPSGPIHPG